MMKRIFAVLLLALTGVLYLTLKTPESTVTVTNAIALPIGESNSMFMVTMDLQNDGPPVILTDVSSPSGAAPSVMNPKSTYPLVVPGNSKAQLAMDGAHLMLGAADFLNGDFKPIALTFDDGSRVTARIQRADRDAAKMYHGMAGKLRDELTPRVEIIPPDVSRDGFTVQIAVENLEFVVVDNHTHHVPGQGHAHVYLNGLKLGRLYETSFDVGPLKPGNYRLEIGLNTNDHRTYIDQGMPIVAIYDFTLR